MANGKASVTSLFGDLLSPNEMRRFTEAQDLQMGQALAQAPAGRAGLLFAPGQVTAMERLGRRVAGQDPRSQQEIEMAQNKEMFTRITQQAQQQFPNDRTAQLNYIADTLTAEGKVAEGQKARALAQQSAQTAQATAADRARELKGLAEADKAMRAPVTEFGEIKPYQIEDKTGNRKTVFGAFDTQGQFYIQDPTGKLAASSVQPVAEGEVASRTAFATQSLSDITGIPNNVLQQYDPTSVKKANDARIRGPKEGETDIEFTARINNLLNMPADKTLNEGEAPPVPFSEFVGIPDSLLDDYSAGSRKRARQIYAEGAKEGETQAQFQKRILDSLLVGLSPEQKKRAQQLASSAEVAVRGAPGFNKFFSVIDDAITGTGADFFTGVGRLINTLGGNVEGISETEYVNRLMSEETLNSSQMMSGTLTDNDIRFLQETVSTLGNTKEAIKIAFAQLEADKLIDQIVYNAYMKEPDKANFNESEVIREVQTEVLKRVSAARGVNLL